MVAGACTVWQVTTQWLAVAMALAHAARAPRAKTIPYSRTSPTQRIQTLVVTRAGHAARVAGGPSRTAPGATDTPGNVWARLKV
jgi:hypothetical protein